MRLRWLASVLVFGGCFADPAERPATWSYLHAALIVPSCATSSCHSGRVAVAGVALDDADRAYDALLARNFVIPGDLASALLALLEGDERRRMPPDAPLPAADVELVRVWILEGAPR